MGAQQSDMSVTAVGETDLSTPEKFHLEHVRALVSSLSPRMQTRARSQACARASAHTNAAHTNAACTRACARVHTLTHPYTHTHTHTHTQRRSFIDNHHDFGMDKATFKEFVTEALPTAADSATLLWERFDTNRTKMVNALEVSTALFGTR